MFVGSAVPRNAQIAIGLDNGTPLTATALAEVVRDAWVDNVMPLLSETITLANVKVKLGPNATGAEVTIGVGEPGGEAAAEPLPPNVAILVRKNTALGGHVGSGRMFIPGIPEDVTTGGGQLVPASLAAFQGALAGFLDALFDGDASMVLLHTGADVPNIVDNLAVQQLMATQKRRIRRAGGRRSAP